MTRAPHRIAIYDLDRTLTRRPTWTPFLLRAAAARAPWRLALVPAAAAAGAAYKAGLIGRGRLKEIMHALMLGRALPQDSAEALAEAFAARTDAGNIRPGARARIAADRAEGYRPVLATAASRFYAERIAQRLGIADVIATGSRRSGDGHLMNRLDGKNIYGPAKRAAIEAWLQEAGIARTAAHIRFYTDHASDAPSLTLADEAFAVNPHAPLRRLARARGWPVLDWEEAGKDGRT